jgi:hypothetical protein
VKPIPILLGLAFFAGANFFPFQHLVAQSPGVTATVQFSNGQSVNVADFSGLIGIQPSELVNVRLQFNPDAIGEPIIIEALGGGRTSIGSSIRVVEADGSLSFAYLATASPGPKSIGIRRGSGTSCMQFWVLDPANPRNNPPVITPGSHG